MRNRACAASHIRNGYHIAWDDAFHDVEHHSRPWVVYTYSLSWYLSVEVSDAGLHSLPDCPIRYVFPLHIT
jgi:hypothetical protein